MRTTMTLLTIIDSDEDSHGGDDDIANDDGNNEANCN